MTYKELLEKYKEDLLDNETKDKVKADIEKHEAISDYLYEEENDSLLNFMEVVDFDLEDSQKETNDQDLADDESEVFVKKMKSLIRKTLIKVGVTTGAVVLAITLLIIFVLPRVTDLMFYNPGKEIKGKDEMINNVMSIDYASFSEIFTPEQYITQVDVNSNGYGKYDIVVRQNISFDGNFRSVSGKIERNKLTLYDQSFMKFPFSNDFKANTKEISEYNVSEEDTDKADCKEVIENMVDKERYMAYVTLDKVYDYQEFVNLCKKEFGDNDSLSNPRWIALCRTNTVDYEDEKRPYRIDDAVTGCLFNSSCSSFIYDEEKYPKLAFFDALEAQNDEYILEENMKTHITSLYSYMADQEEFCNMFDLNRENLKNMAEDVQKNGIHIYGYSIITQKEELEKLIDKGYVKYITTRPYK